MLAEFGGPLELNRHWAYSLYKRMKFVRRKATTAKSKYTIADFERVKKTFLDEVISTVSMEEIPPELILNWDQTGIKIVPSSPWTMDRRGARRVEMIGTSDKRQITAVFCGTLVGDFLPIQLITPRRACAAKGLSDCSWTGLYNYIIIYIVSAKNFSKLKKYSLSEVHFNTGRLLFQFNGLQYNL